MSLPYSKRTIIIVVATLFLLAAIPLTVVVVRQAREPKSRAAGPLFTISSVSLVAKEIGTDGNNNTANVDVCGADLGSMFDWNGKTYIIFGDTFGCPASSDPPNWRSNTIAYTEDATPANGLAFDGWIVGSDAKAKEVIPNDTGSGIPSDETAIPTYGVAIGNTAYIYYWEGQVFGGCRYSQVAKSSDGGQNWAKLSSLRWGLGNFNQVAAYKKSGYVYFFGIPCGRLGAVKLMRVAEGSIENKGSYQYLSGISGGNPSWVSSEGSAVNIVSAPVGELSVRWNAYLGSYLMMYLKDVSPYTIEIRSAPELWGPWSDPLVVTTGTTYPCLYAPYMKEGYEDNNGQTVYFRMSRFCPGFNPYSTYWMKLSLKKTASATSPPPSASPPPASQSSPTPAPNTSTNTGTNTEESSQNKTGGLQGSYGAVGFLIKIKVVDKNGQSVKGAQVNFPPNLSEKTDAEGIAYFHNIPEGTYNIEVVYQNKTHRFTLEVKKDAVAATQDFEVRVAAANYLPYQIALGVFLGSLILVLFHFLRLRFLQKR